MRQGHAGSLDRGPPSSSDLIFSSCLSGKHLESHGSEHQHLLRASPDLSHISHRGWKRRLHRELSIMASNLFFTLGASGPPHPLRYPGGNLAPSRSLRPHSSAPGLLIPRVRSSPAHLSVSVSAAAGPFQSLSSRGSMLQTPPCRLVSLPPAPPIPTSPKNQGVSETGGHRSASGQPGKKEGVQVTRELSAFDRGAGAASRSAWRVCAEPGRMRSQVTRGERNPRTGEQPLPRPLGGNQLSYISCVYTLPHCHMAQPGDGGHLATTSGDAKTKVTSCDSNLSQQPYRGHFQRANRQTQKDAQGAVGGPVAPRGAGSAHASPAGAGARSPGSLGVTGWQLCWSWGRWSSGLQGAEDTAAGSHQPEP